MKNAAKQTIEISHSTLFYPYHLTGLIIEEKHCELEKYMKETHNLDASQFAFSTENIVLLNQILEIFDHLGFETSHFSKFDKIYYFYYYSQLQNLLQRFDQHLVEAVEGQKLNPATASLEKFERISYAIKLANACYANLYKNLYDNNFHLLLSNVNKDEEFLKLMNGKGRISYSCWQSKALTPAFCIYIDEENETVAVCFRGSVEFTDYISDFTCENTSISIMKCPKGQFYVRINKKEGIGFIGGKIRNTRKFCQEKLPPDLHCVEVCRGLTHEGGIKGSIEIYEFLSEKLQKAFEEEKVSKFSLLFTGHSLGGGFAGFMSFLFTIHPLIVNGKEKKCEGFGIGSPPNFSEEISRAFPHFQTNIVNGVDLVPRICFSSLKDVSRVLRELKEIDTNSGLPKILTLNKPLSECDSEFVNKVMKVYISVREKMAGKKYSMAGTAYYFEHVNCSDEVISVLEISKTSCFHQMLFVENHIKHHFPHFYLEYSDQWCELIKKFQK